MVTDGRTGLSDGVARMFDSMTRVSLLHYFGVRMATVIGFALRLVGLGLLCWDTCPSSMSYLSASMSLYVAKIYVVAC
jgi:hypothetical protein